MFNGFFLDTPHTYTYNVQMDKQTTYQNEPLSEPLTERFELRISEKMLASLRKIAEVENTSTAEVMRVFCQVGITQWRRIQEEGSDDE